MWLTIANYSKMSRKPPRHTILLFRQHDALSRTEITDICTTYNLFHKTEAYKYIYICKHKINRLYIYICKQRKRCYDYYDKGINASDRYGASLCLHIKPLEINVSKRQGKSRTTNIQKTSFLEYCE